MPKLKRMSGRALITKLVSFGFDEIRQKGSPVVLKRETPEGVSGCVVPLHKESAIGTIKGILRQAKLTPEELDNFL